MRVKNTIMVKNTILFFLLLSALIPQAWAADFGEDEDYLGQVVDDYENDDNIAATVNIINNLTLGCMELNYSDVFGINWVDMYFIEYFENFPVGWTIASGNGGTITKSDLEFFNGSYSARVYSPLLNSYCYGYSLVETSMGDSITSFHIWIDPSIQPDGLQIIGLQDTVLGGYVWRARLHYHDSNYYLQSDNGGVWTDVTLISPSTWEEVVIYFNDTSDKVHFYLNGLSKGEFDALQGDRNANRVYVGDVSNSVQKGFFYIDDLLIGSGNIFQGGYVDGFYYTEEVLKGDPALAILYNLTIPDGGGATMEFSTDNVTWVDHNNQAGSDTLIAGYEALDLRDIYNGTIYRRVNMTSNGINTPRMYQERLVTVTTITPSGGGLFPGLAIGISLLIIGAIYAVEKRR